jgi:hypothetical protein
VRNTLVARCTVNFVTQADALTAKWRRFNEAVDRVRSAQAATDKAEIQDAVNAALHALYELWEYWRAKAPSRRGKDDDFVRSDPDGETAAALVHARGATTHRVFQEHGDFTDTYAQRFYDHYGCWRWEHFSDPNPKYTDRDTWYRTHVAGREVNEPFEAASRWLNKRPELGLPE